MDSPRDEIVDGRSKAVSFSARVASLVAVLLAVIVLPGTLAWSILHVASVSGQVSANQQSNTKALCALRADVQERVTNGEAFLRVHPRGIPGVPVSSIQVGLDNEKRTVVALRFVRCPDASPHSR